MNMFPSIKVVFSATLGANVYRSQIVTLGGAFPSIEIENCETPEGLHNFKIEKAVPHLGSDMIKSVIAEASQEIEVFWNVLAFVRGSAIRRLDRVSYENNGQTITVQDSTGQLGRPTLQGVAGESWFSCNCAQFHQHYNYDLLKRFNFARTLDDPVSRFLALYALLSNVTDDDQAKLDALIVSIEPTIARTISPWNGKPETTFSRLRNELAHNRTGTDVLETHREIALHVERFDWIVSRVLRPKIVRE